MAIKYFLFSKEQMDLRTNIEKKIGNTFVPGKVIVNGTEKLFTELSDSPDSQYKDAKVVAKLDTDKTKYSEPTVE